MPRKPKKFASTERQLLLFEPEALPKIAAPISASRDIGRPEPEILRPAASPFEDRLMTARLLPPNSDSPIGPTPFEKESYELYLKTRREVRGLSTTTAVFTFLLVAVVLLGARIQEISVGLFKIGAISETIVVGVLGWCSVLWGIGTLFQAAFAAYKKQQCGLFYQRVLRFYPSPFADVLGQIRTIVYVIAVAGAILLSLILARHQMLHLVTFIIKGLLNLASMSGWETTVTPVSR
jgi:hypothetical protein